MEKCGQVSILVCHQMGPKLASLFAFTCAFMWIPNIQFTGSCFHFTDYILCTASPHYSTFEYFRVSYWCNHPCLLNDDPASIALPSRVLDIDPWFSRQNFVIHYDTPVRHRACGFQVPPRVLTSSHTDAINRHIKILGHLSLSYNFLECNFNTNKITSWYVLKKWTIGIIYIEQTIAATIYNIEMMECPINIVLTLKDPLVKLWNFPRSINGAQLLCTDYWVSTKLYIRAERATRGLSEDWNLMTLCIEKSS